MRIFAFTFTYILFFNSFVGEAGGTVEFLKDKEYLGTVQDMHLNGDYCAVRFDGKILLHVLEVARQLSLIEIKHPV